MNPQWLAMFSDVASWLWWVGAGVFLIVELTTGTFYLLMLALGFLFAGLARLAGVPPEWQVFAAAAFSGLAILLVRVVKRRYRQRTLRAAAASGGASTVGAEVQASLSHNALHSSTNPASDLDAGAPVYVAAWQQRRARAQYRGAEWDVALADGVPDVPGWFRIQRIDGIRLILAL
jgi:membrane protein implicated in regulation of membrane protease activity